MRAIEWNKIGRRFFETGVDRGVLYPNVGPGVSWSGLITVEETASGGELSSYYYDGTKYLDFVAGEDFSGSISAYTYPDEFEECDGNTRLVPGLLVTRQSRKTFGLCYRTMLGSDTNRIGKDYKLHLVYNLITQPTTKTRNTLTGTPDPSAFQWSITAVPPLSTTYKPTPHIIIDTRDIEPIKLQYLEVLLYGNIPDGVVIDGGFPDFTSDGIFDGSTPDLSSFDELEGGYPWSDLLLSPALPPQSDVITFLS